MNWLDLQLEENGNGGTLTISGNDYVWVSGLENMLYLSLFGGNKWPGNDLILDNEDDTVLYTCLTEEKLRTTPLTSAGRVLIDQAVHKDIAWIKDKMPDTKVTTDVRIVSDNEVLITITVAGKSYEYRWAAGATYVVPEVPVLVCPIITGLAVTDIDTSSLTFGWDAIAAAGYQYAYNTTGDEPETTDWTYTAATTMLLEGLTGGIEYFFFVRTLCATGFYSSSVSISETTTPVTCAIPTGLSVVAGTTTATLNWLTPNSAGIKLKYLLNTTGIMPSLAFATGAAVDSTDLSVTVSGLTSLMHYYIWIRTRCSETNYSTWTFKEFTTT